MWILWWWLEIIWRFNRVQLVSLQHIMLYTSITEFLNVSIKYNLHVILHNILHKIYNICDITYIFSSYYRNDRKNNLDESYGNYSYKPTLLNLWYGPITNGTRRKFPFLKKYNESLFTLPNYYLVLLIVNYSIILHI